MRARVLVIGWRGLQGRSGPNKVSMLQAPRLRNVFRFHCSSKIVPTKFLYPRPQSREMFSDFMVKVELGFQMNRGNKSGSWNEKLDLIYNRGDTLYESICFVALSRSNVVSRPQSLKSITWNLKFQDFIGFMSWFLRKWGRFCWNWSQSSRLTARYVFRA